MIGGVGAVPEDLGIEMSKTLFAPRVGAVYRLTESTVVRAGFGITNDPYSLARPFRTNYPVVLELQVDAPNSFAWASETKNGIPVIPDPDLGNGIITIPSTVARQGAAPEVRARLHQVVEHRHPAPVALGFRGRGRVRRDPAGRPAGQPGDELRPHRRRQQPGACCSSSSAAPASTTLTTKIGDAKYDALQTRLDRRFANGIQFGVNYTYSRAEGIAGAANSDNTPRIAIPEYYHLNYGRSDIDRPHAFNLTSVAELPFGTGRRWLNEGGILSAIVGGWQLNNIISAFTGAPFNVTAAGNSLNAPGNTQRGDLVGTPTILGGIGRGNAYFDVNAFAPVTEPRFGTAPWNVMYGPGYWTWDLGLFRQVQFLGRTRR